MFPIRVLSLAVAVPLTLSACTESSTAPDVDAQFAANGTAVDRSGAAIDYAVIGDVPYGPAAAERFPSLIEAINADPKVRRAVHVGDTKNGSTVCSDEWFDFIYKSFQDFKDPLVYSPGDNEWTDCHRDNNGNWNPLERLDRIREVYFSSPGRTLGGRGKRVMTQDGYPENQLWFESEVAFAAIHVVGSNNNRAPWTCYQPFDADCMDGTSPESAAMTAAREAEATARDAANRTWLDRTFDLAEERGAVGVVVFGHGDMWHPADVAAGDVDFSGHQQFVERLATRSAAFGDPVILFAGDSHDFRVDQPLISDTNYFATDAPNLTQITVDRSIEGDIVWLRLHVDPTSTDVFSWEEVVVPQ